MDPFDYLDDLFEPVMVCDQDESIIYFNASFLTLFKTTPRALKKQTDARTYLCELIPDFAVFFEELNKSSQVISSELTFILEGQLCTIIAKGAKKDSGHLVLFFKDVTVEKQLNDKYRAQLEELKNTHAQIIQSDKLKVIGEMTANISHEINNPLTVAIGNCELIGFSLETEDLNEQRTSITKFSGNIAHSLERINKIIANMKEFLHKSEDKKEYCDAKEIIEKAIAFTNPSLKGTPIEINISMEGQSPILLVNQVKIEQVFVNLIQNAIDSLKDSNTVHPTISIDCKVDGSGNFVHIGVRDNGPGISAENRAKIFNTFFTTKEIGKGTGLGLSISNRIIETHQGKLELMESAVGAYFKIVLPAIGIAGHMNGNWEKLITEGDKLTRVLVVDNEINILNLCMNFLSDSDYHFMGATSAEEALKELERTNVDMIITDVKMPLVGGENFVRALRAKNISVPVLFMTSKEFVDKYKALKQELGLKGIVIKPFTKDELIGAISAAVND
jgi:signal transduction histidine kinase/ActR/RegA family two-component response regulator